MAAVEYTKSFTISVVLGKDVVPRIGLNQMESLRADLINAIKRSVDPKWKIIACSVMCCCGSQPTSATELSATEGAMAEYMNSKNHVRCVGGVHPSDSTIALTSHHPLYPPGRIIHIVRHHPTKGEQALSKHEPVYQALWAQNTDFDEVLISPVMIQDHMPDKVLEALAKVITTLGPRKPQRSTSYNTSPTIWEEYRLLAVRSSPIPPSRVYLETSFTSLQSPSVAPSNASSITNGFYPIKNNSFSPGEFQNVISILDNKHTTKVNVDVQVNVQKLDQNLNLSRKAVSEGSIIASKSVDLIHDDWFGLAPLASPESLSELSSISSRTSFTNNFDKIGHTEIKTPKMMRRTPKIIGSLNTCADDIRNVRCFQKLGYNAKLMPFALRNESPITNSSSNLSYESAASSRNDNEHYVDSSKCCWKREEDINASEPTNNSGESDDFQSAEDILNNVLATAGCSEFFNSQSNFLETHFDETMFDNILESKPNQIQVPEIYFTQNNLSFQSSPHPVLSPSSPQELDPDILLNFAIDLNLDEEHRSAQFSQRNLETPSSKVTSLDSGSMCRTPSDMKTVTFNPEIVNINSVLLSRKSPEVSPHKQKKSDRWHLLPLRHKNTKVKKNVDSPKITKTEIVPKAILCSKRQGSDDECFSRTEDLPLLSGRGSGNVEKSSPNFVRRKKYVYPTITFVSREESV